MIVARLNLGGELDGELDQVDGELGGELDGELGGEFDGDLCDDEDGDCSPFRLSCTGGGSPF